MNYVKNFVGGHLKPSRSNQNNKTHAKEPYRSPNKPGFLKTGNSSVPV